MCFSANASFLGSAIICAVGVATLRYVRQRRALLFAAVPLLFAIHQFTEGFVWLGVDKVLRPDATAQVTLIYMLCAQGILPFLMPLAVLLIEPPGIQKMIILFLTVLGAAILCYVLYALSTFHNKVLIDHYCLRYHNPATDVWWFALAYVLASCGALVASSHRFVRWFGVLNVTGVIVTLLAMSYAFTSIWCLYAAIVSLVLYWQFSHRHVDMTTPNSRLDGCPGS